ncbi:hypothetical protein [Natrinema salinisoli]|uniref:hypothetical protein n=1 Tax=Natrinema salinisoli TaxID=2878535 RepID=UPI001CEFF491|nr:hypothetical protein [Natrinema salinisoli]
MSDGNHGQDPLIVCNIKESAATDELHTVKAALSGAGFSLEENQYEGTIKVYRTDPADREDDHEAADEDNSETTYTCSNCGQEFDAPVKTQPKYHDCPGSGVDTITWTPENVLTAMQDNGWMTTHEIAQEVTSQSDPSYAVREKFHKQRHNHPDLDAQIESRRDPADGRRKQYRIRPDGEEKDSATDEEEELTAFERRYRRLDNELEENTPYTSEELAAIAFDKEAEDVTASNKAYISNLRNETDLELEDMQDPNRPGNRKLYYRGEKPTIEDETDDEADEATDGVEIHPDYVADCPDCDYCKEFQDTDEADAALETHITEEHSDDTDTNRKMGEPVRDAPEGRSDADIVRNDETEIDGEQDLDDVAPVSAEEEDLNDATFTATETGNWEKPVEDEVTDDITDVLPDDIPIKELSKADLIKLLHYRTDRSQEEIADLVGAQQSYVSLVTGDLPDSQQPEIVGSVHECREHDVVRYIKCVECDAVFDLEAVARPGRVQWDNKQDPVTHVNWFQHNRFEGYVVKPEGEEPPDRPDGAVKNHRIVS